jgi:beta-glucosidase
LPGVPRLGIPERRDADALGIEVVAESTAPPMRLGLAATFDRAAAYSFGQLEGREGRALGVDLIYAPQVDLMRQPNWIRNNTGFGEDPFLIGRLGIEEVRGIQSEGLMAMVKHYAIYHGQAGAGGGSRPGEPTLPTVVDERTARELYLEPFEHIIIKGQPAAVMASYQGFKILQRQETPLWATDNPFTLETILRDEWDFRGFVLSDYGATHSVHTLLSGLDQDYPGWRFFGVFQFAHFQDDLKPLVDPTSPTYDPVYAAALDEAVARVLYGYERFGLLEDSPPPRPDMSNLKDEHAEIAERPSEQSAVLLKNEGRVLPLKGSDLKSVAVIGPTGRQVMANGDQTERSRGFSDRVAISPFQMLQELAPANSNFTFAPGIDWIGSVVPPRRYLAACSERRVIRTPSARMRRLVMRAPRAKTT